MKKNLKTILSLVLTLVMVVAASSAFVANVMADGMETQPGYYYDYQTLTLGENTVTPQAGFVTLYDLSLSETGKYILTLSDENGFVGYYGSNEWSPINNATLSSTLEFNYKEVGQPIIIGISGTTSATLTIVKEGEADKGDTVPVIEYENKFAVEKFNMPKSIDPDYFEFVDIDDTTEDKAVLGEDGYYHLNAANGPVLFASIDDSVVSLLNMYSYGQLRAAVYEGKKAVCVYDYHEAFLEYFEASGGVFTINEYNELTIKNRGCGYYPLTEDLMTMFKLLGNSQEWFKDTGIVGGKLPNGDAWMFACAYDEEYTVYVAETNNDNNNDGNDNDGNNNNGNNNGDNNGTTGSTDDDVTLSPETGDANILVIYGLFFVAAIGLFGMVKRTK